MSLLNFFKKEGEEERSTQAFLDIAQIKDSVIILKTGGLRMILEVPAVNFDLKSEQEQDALIAQYQGFLNSLDFPIQILIHSRRIDLSPYLENLKRRFEQEGNELLRAHMADYMGFLHELISQANIMDKKYFIVVPFNPVVPSPSSLLGIGARKESVKMPDTAFSNYKDELNKRASVVSSGLMAMGLRANQLDTQALTELFYNIYNPEIATEEHLKRIEELVAPVIKEVKNQKA